MGDRIASVTLKSAPEVEKSNTAVGIAGVFVRLCGYKRTSEVCSMFGFVDSHCPVIICTHGGKTE